MAKASSLVDVSVQFPQADEIIKVLLLQSGHNTASVMLGAGFLGVAAGVVGTFALLRKRALMGDAIAHASLPGICTAFLLLTSLGFAGRNLFALLLGATFSGLLCIACVHLLARHTRLSEDAAIGAVLSVFFGAGVVLLSIIQTLGTGNEGGLHDFIYGQTAAMRRVDALVLAYAAGLTLLSSLLMLKEFRIVCFDSAFAEVQGWPSNLIDAAMMGLVIGVTVIGLQSVGIILIVALLIVPAAAARFWTENLNIMTLTAGLIGGISGYFGAAASALFPRLPAGAVIVSVCGVLFALSMFFAPRRGVLATTLRHSSLSLRVAREHLLRTIYETLETSPQELKAGKALSIAELKNHLGAVPNSFVVFMLRTQGLLRRQADGSLALTESGFAEAARVTRNHRLWEEYIVLHGQLAVSHVDYSADLVEHVLSQSIVAELVEVLRRAGRLPQHASPAESLHPLTGGAA
ncbi:MAG: metal ABC transporter permease [Bdellovibrionales bacterium]|nr:metal ABC transporter permease [Bdellovibrionales bacterium]